MHPGRHLEAFARRVTRVDTFDQLVSPAIADLQCEAPRSGLCSRTRHYIGALTVLAYALARDFRLDLKTASDSDALQQVWTRATFWYLGVAVVLTLAGLRDEAHWSWGFGTFLTTFETEGAMPWHLLSAEQTTAAVMTALLQGLVSALPFAMAAAAFHLCRQNRCRTIVAAVVVVATFSTAVGLSMRPVRASTNRVLYERVAPQVADPGRNVGDGQHWKEWLQSRQREFDRPVAFWMDLQKAAMVIPFALFGLVLARRRGWGVLGGAVQIVVTLIFVFAPLSFLPVPAFPQGQWIVTAGMVVAGMLRLRLDGSTKPLKARER